MSGGRGAAGDHVAELVGAVADPTLQLADDLIAAHLHAIRRADGGGERGLVDVVVLVEAPRLVEQPPLLATEQHRASPVRCQQVQHLRFLGCRQVGWQQIGAVNRRVRGSLPRHQVPFAVRKA